MEMFLPDNFPEYIEKGIPVVGHQLWSRITDDEDKIRYWLGAEPHTWLVIAGALYNAGPEGRAVAEGIAYGFNMTRKD